MQQPLYAPARPTLAATGLLTLWIAILSLPMLAGKWLAGPWSDQVSAGLPFRGWGAEWWRRLGHVPLWNPEIFGGMPYVGALGTGDVLYPTAALLRLVVPTATAINIGFFVHYVLAGLFTYLFLRSLRVSWTGAVVGGIAYQLSGIMASYVQPGHDGKLVVSALMPLVLMGLVYGMRDRRPSGYVMTALGVALSIFTQHVQITYYMLITAGLFALYLTFGVGPLAPVEQVRRLGLGLGAVILGFGIAAIQLLPAFAHMPLSARAVSVQGGFEGATSYAIPWMHLPEFFLKQFVGWGTTYWGSNPIKLHSEYLGLPVVALALFGARGEQDRRLRLWLAGIGLLFLLIALGGGTPFYRIWWTLMPYVKQMRAPGMAFFVVAFVVACFAAFGVQRLERVSGTNLRLSRVRGWLIAAGVLALLAAIGVFGQMANALAGPRAGAVYRSAILLGALTSAVALGAVAAVCWAYIGSRVRAGQWAIALALIIGADLWLNARPYWVYSTEHKTLYSPDAITQRIQAGPMPSRTLDLGAFLGPAPHPAYPGNVLMALDVPQLLGEHGFEIRYFTDVLGGRGEWRNITNLRLWDLFAVRWVLVPAATRGLDSIPGYKRVLQGAMTSAGAPADLFERITPAPYAQVVPAAISLDSAAVVATLADPRMAYDRVVLLDAREGTAGPAPTQLPPASPARAAMTHWEPGRMSITLDPVPPAASYLLVSENWYPDWRATVDGKSTKLLRGDWTLITVPVPAGAARVELTFSSAAFRTGELLTLFSLMIGLAAVIWPAASRRWRAPRRPV